MLAGYQGVAQTDDYAGYNKVFVPEGCVRLACLAHIRRNFIEAQLNKVNPWEWLSDVLVRVNVASDDTPVSLLPMNWKRKPVG